MYQLNLGKLSLADFMQQYWQKQPLLIKQGFKNFQDPLSANELAGLALEDDVESRLVECRDGNWQLETGPFEDFSRYGDKDWTILVQAVDHWHPPAAELIEPFRFIPNWRIDDLMVSFSTPGGGVGPHLDQYDVFIIQGEGKRHWRVGMPDASLKQFCPHPRLLQVTPFTACIDVIMEPGDILYIPPGCPHEGISLENSLNYSVGFRAPAQKDLLTGLADYLLDNDISGKRFSDPDRNLTGNIGAISEQDLDQVQQLLVQLVSDRDKLPLWFGQYITQAKHELDQQEPDPHYQAEEIAEYLEEGSVLARLGGLRCSYYQTNESSDIQLFINGTTIVLPAEEQMTAQLLCDSKRIDQQQCLHFTAREERLLLLTDLINQGLWYFEE
ncbi:cupin domain-containing protein [Alishewanella jeotgali]|uniref:RmlC-like domain-containing protein n=1 Tax=Alishewanella jeotgali KCTC 22429 TaxID=1129374 RepID=H3ZAP8_9ALTE|nr:cupin domain-containing protein [Alishewanella jeotgali]EHR42012.1 RmlC-like domain-containing protein [Alishewanella jeotgali KCTC 22429]